MCGRLGRCCRSLKLLVLSLVLVGLNICDFGVGAVSIAWAIDHRHRNVYFVAAYGSCLVVAVALSSLALADARFPRSIVFAAYVAVLCTAFELYVIVQLDVDADAFAAATGTGRAVAARVDAAPTWLFVAVALRSLVRLALSLSVRATRGRAAPEFSQLPMSNLDDAETRRQELSTSLLARERRDDMRSHFDHKYFGGRTAAGAPAPCSTGVRRALCAATRRPRLRGRAFCLNPGDPSLPMNRLHVARCGPTRSSRPSWCEIIRSASTTRSGRPAPRWGAATTEAAGTAT